MSTANVTFKHTISIDFKMLNVQKYLEENHWEYMGGWGNRDPQGNFYGIQYRKGNHYVTILTSDKIADWNLRVNELFNDLALAENMTVAELVMATGGTNID